MRSQGSDTESPKAEKRRETFKELINKVMVNSNKAGEGGERGRRGTRVQGEVEL